jgi:hypothetical protein
LVLEELGLLFLADGLFKEFSGDWMLIKLKLMFWVGLLSFEMCRWLLKATFISFWLNYL